MGQMAKKTLQSRTPGTEPTTVGVHSPEKPTSSPIGPTMPPPPVEPEVAKPWTLTDDERIALVQARFDPMRHGARPEALKVLADRFGGRDQDAIGKAIISAFRDGLVDIEVIKKPTFTRERHLEEQLQDKYDLTGAIVVGSSGIRTRDRDGNLVHTEISSDELHRKLGYALAGYVGGAQVFRDGDTIGFGSGRGVFYACKSIAWELTQRSLRIKHVNLVSLTGAVHARAHESRLNARLDADFHCGLFGMCVDDHALLRLIAHPIAYATSQELQDARGLTWLGEWDAVGAKQYANVPKVALIGVGVLSEGHRFYEQAKTAADQQDPILRPIIDPLTELVTICDDISSRMGFCPVADICNHLFIVEPTAKTPMPMDTHDKITDLINLVNSKLLNIKQEQLQQIERIVLCAATSRKSLAIKQLLERRAYHIKYLCTDEVVARELLGLSSKGQSTTQHYPGPGNRL